MASQATRVITLEKADFAVAIALGHWSKLVDRVVSFVLTGPDGPRAWRSETSNFWQPLGETTLVRIVQAFSVPSSPARWTELQNPAGQVLHIDNRDSEIRFQVNAEIDLYSLKQVKQRAKGVWVGDDLENRMRIRIPHR